MSEENVELVRSLLEMFQRREHERVFDVYDPAIEWDASRLEEAIPDAAGVYRGHDGVRAYRRRWLQAWANLEFEVQDVLDGRRRGRGADPKSTPMGTPQRRRYGISALQAGVHDFRREGHTLALVPRPGAGPRSRGPVGVRQLAVPARPPERHS
jgi:ketosteroid isomerase-like protein